MKLQTVFNTIEEYELSKDSEDISYPNVSYIVEDDSVRYIYDSAFEFVDLGLSVQWATCNVGANNPEEYGLYFAWGETQGYSGITDDKQFSLYDYKFYNGSGGGSASPVSTDTASEVAFTKYNEYDGLTTLQAKDDAVTLLDKAARIPTAAEIDELLYNTTSELTAVNGVNGVRLTASNGNSIFLPLSGSCYEGVQEYIGEYGTLWSSTMTANYNSTALSFDYGIDNYITLHDYQRFIGVPLRAVKQNGNSVTISNDLREWFNTDDISFGYEYQLRYNANDIRNYINEFRYSIGIDDVSAWGLHYNGRIVNEFGMYQDDNDDHIIELAQTYGYDVRINLTQLTISYSAVPA